MLGSNPSAESGTKTGQQGGERLHPLVPDSWFNRAIELAGIRTKAINPPRRPKPFASTGRSGRTIQDGQTTSRNSESDLAKETTVFE